MAEAFLKVVIPTSELPAQGPSWRHEIEDALSAALVSFGLGDVSGGGVSGSTMNIDVDVSDEASLYDAGQAIRTVLRQHGVPATTIIRRNEPQREVFGLDESP
jgi:hypothetical protein